MAETTQERWTRGSARELRFWGKWIAGDGQLLAYTGANRIPAFIAKHIPRQVNLSRPRVRIADLGAGAWSHVGTYLPGIDVEIVASDIFAEEYMANWRSQTAQPLVAIEKQDMTALTYPDDSFDIVHCSNALDHTTNPFAAIAEMKRVCKPGGWILLRHQNSVGLGNHYTGLHLWNITPEDDDLRIWSDHEQEHGYLSALLPGVTMSILSAKPKRLAEWRKP